MGPYLMGSMLARGKQAGPLLFPPFRTPLHGKDLWRTRLLLPLRRRLHRRRLYPTVGLATFARLDLRSCIISTTRYAPNVLSAISLNECRLATCGARWWFLRELVSR